MSGPPDNVEAADLWRKLHEFPQPSEVVDFPRRFPKGHPQAGQPLQKVRIQVLCEEQHDEARLRAIHHLREDRKLKLEDMGTTGAEAVLGDATAVELLALAVVSVKPMQGTADDRPRYPRLFESGAKVRAALTADEVAALFALYLQVQRMYGPHSRTVSSDDDLNWWVKRLAEGGQLYPLASLDSLQLAELASSLAARAHTLSLTLESQLSSLPPTLASDLKSFGIGTGFFGEQPESDAATGGANSDDGLLAGLAPGETLSVEAAVAIAKKLKD